MKAFLDGFLPIHYPGLNYLCLVHEGKSDLQKSIKIKVPRWKVPGDAIIILHDCDGLDCKQLKNELNDFCGSSIDIPLKIRIVCQELESWYFGQAAVVESHYGSSMRKKIPSQAKNAPDSFRKPSEWLERAIPSFQKVAWAAVLSTKLNRTSTSKSFLAFLSAVDGFAKGEA
jgi:hypothetical protein